jgi:ribosomal protein L16 Arg81 hydroxylase
LRVFGIRSPPPTSSRFARRDDVESRLVVRTGSRWSLEHGPFARADLRGGFRQRNWTLLVQGRQPRERGGDALLRRFAFIPYARLDDLMVSYAAPGRRWVPTSTRMMCSCCKAWVGAGGDTAGRKT